MRSWDEFDKHRRMKIATQIGFLLNTLPTQELELIRDRLLDNAVEKLPYREGNALVEKVKSIRCK